MIADELDIWDVGIIATITDEVVAITTVDTFEGFTSGGNLHPRGTMIVVPTLVVIRSCFNAPGIHAPIQALVE